MSLTLTPDLLRMLIDYNPETGAMVWRERSALMYRNVIPDISLDEAKRRADVFNTMWAGRVVGTDQVYKSRNRRVRISFGPGVTAVRKNTASVAWMIGSGQEVEDGCEVITWDGDPLNLTAENIIETTQHVRHILENPEAGLIERADGHWTWVIRMSSQRLRGVGEQYETQEGARAARDAKLTELGLNKITRLSELVDG